MEQSVVQAAKSRRRFCPLVQNRQEHHFHIKNGDIHS